MSSHSLVNQFETILKNFCSDHVVSTFYFYTICMIQFWPLTIFCHIFIIHLLMTEELLCDYDTELELLASKNFWWVYLSGLYRAKEIMRWPFKDLTARGIQGFLFGTLSAPLILPAKTSAPIPPSFLFLLIHSFLWAFVNTSFQRTSTKTAKMVDQHGVIFVDLWRRWPFFSVCTFSCHNWAQDW